MRALQILPVLMFVLLFAGVGTYVLTHSHAATTTIVGDLNGDGTVDIFDLSILLSNWGKTATVTTIPNHIETWAYDDGCNGGKGASSSLVQTWLTYAEVHCGRWTTTSPVKAINDCHSGSQALCQVMEYVDTDITYTGSPPDDLGSSFFNFAQESWFLHEPSPNQATRVTTPSFGGGYKMNQNTAAYQAWWKKSVNDDFPNTDGLFMDDQGAGLPYFGFSSTSSSEITTTAQELAAHLAMSNAITKPGTSTPYPQADNTIPDCGNPFEASGQGLTAIAGPVNGLLAEGCPMSNGTMVAFFPGILDDMAYVNKSTSGYTMLLSYGASGASYQQQERRVQQATVMLAYEPGRVVSWAELEQNGSGNLAIWPEEGIYPTSPVQSMGNPSGTGCFTGSGSYCPIGGHNDIQTSVAGVFRREFNTCYNQGVSFGACAVIVNTTGSAVTAPASSLTHAYGHQVTFNGGDVESGGTINLTGGSFTSGSTTVAAHDAILLAP
jgi:hypothetical protein